jgi:hypothetical protein
MTGLTKNGDYVSNGVAISPALPSTGDTVKISYDGLLAKNGANHLYAHVGFGNRWDRVTEYKMTKKSTSFEAAIPISSGDTMNVCFKDCANNWDNNSGMNYSFDIIQ